MKKGKKWLFFNKYLKNQLNNVVMPFFALKNKKFIF